MKSLLYAGLVLGLVTGFAYGGLTVLVVSDCDVPGGAGADHEDDELVSWLQSFAGVTVDTSGMNKQMQDGAAVSPWAAGNEAKKAALEAADWVLVSRRTTSGSYDGDRKNWNELATPLLTQSGYLIRGEVGNKIWGWVAQASADTNKATMTMAIVAGQEGHAYLAGIDTSGPVTVFDMTLGPEDPNNPGNPYTQLPKSVFLANTPTTRAGTLIATYDGRDMLTDIAAGTDLDALNGTTGKYGVTGEKRVFFAQWGYDQTPVDWRWDDYLTDDYKQVLINVMGLPEPATLALMGLGAAAMFIRRRR